METGGTANPGHKVRDLWHVDSARATASSRA